MSKFTRKHVTTSLVWKTSEIFFSVVVNLVVKLALAYLLEPEHFGLIGMAFVFVAFVELFADLGFGASLIQRKESDLTPAHWNSVFWCNLLVNWAGFMLIVFWVSSLAAIYYGDEILESIVIGISVSLIWTPLIFIQRIKLNKAMEFKKLFVIQSTSIIIGGIVALLMALNGFGVWSLVGQGVSSSLTMLLITWMAVKWRPELSFDIKAVKDLFSFGVYDMSLRIVGFSHLHANILILGGLFNPLIVGYFVFAQIFTINVFKPINKIFKKVYFPLFSNIQDNRILIKKYYLRQIQYITAFLHPLNVGLILLAPDFITLIWGEKWVGAIYPLQYLAIFVSLIAAGGEIGPILKGIGKIKKLFYVHIIRFVVIKIPIIIIGALLYGFEGFLFGIVLSQIVILFVNYMAIKNHIDLRGIDLIKSNIGGLIGASVMGCVIYVLQYMQPQRDLIFLILLSIFGVIVYIFAYYILGKISSLSNWVIPINYRIFRD
jgi:teichuronic acid exporter